MKRAAVLCIGTELTRGEHSNGNATWLAEALTRVGFEVTALLAVDDDRERIGDAVQRLGREHAVVVSTGGLGPTTDDVTTEAVARRLGLSLERHAPSLEVIRARLERHGRSMAVSNEKQADFPQGAQILENQSGTAPGFSIQVEAARCFFLPGVPREMRAMFEAGVAPAVASLAQGAHHQILLRTFGLPESEVGDRLKGIEEEHPVTLGYRATFPVIEVKVLARADSRTDAETRARAAADQVRARLGDRIVFAEGDRTLAQALGDLLLERGLRLACAESCTGGLIGELVTARGGASAFFAGSAVVYENRAKSVLLGVDAGLIASHGAVSQEVARAMAEGACRAFGVDVGIGVTGIAGPDGGTEEKPVGLVHWAIATEAGVTDRHRVFAGTREQIRLRAAYAALGLARQVVLSGHSA